MSARPSFYIWWTSGADCLAIGDPWTEVDADGPRAIPAGAPAYVRRAYSARFGRNGRGRLWVPHELEGAFPRWVDAGVWDDAKDAAKAIERGSHGGIVIRAIDLESVIRLPGFVTDLELERVP